MRYELVIADATPSLNRTQRRHWTHGYRLKKRWMKLVWVAVTNQLPMQRIVPLPRAKVTVTRYAPRPIQDRDNRYGGAKSLIDALVKNGLIVDDSEDHIDLHVVEGKWLKGESPHTHVLIEAFANG